MNKKYLDGIRYNWELDNRKLKIDGQIPDARCLCCGRIFLNADHAIVFCKLCDQAMSICRDGYEHDFDTWGNKIEFKDGSKIKLTARREVRTPIDFDKEHDSEYQERLYNLQGEDKK